jgi:hypothetical protein
MNDGDWANAAALKTTKRLHEAATRTGVVRMILIRERWIVPLELAKDAG